MRKRQLEKEVERLKNELAQHRYYYDGVLKLLVDLGEVYPNLKNKSGNHWASGQAPLKAVDRLKHQSIATVAEYYRQDAQEKFRQTVIDSAMNHIGL